MNRFCLTTAVLAAILIGNEAWADAYTLPSNKSMLQQCTHVIHDAHDDRVLVITYAPHEGKDYYRYHVRRNDQSEWMLLCDGEIGVIVLHTRLDVWPTTATEAAQTNSAQTGIDSQRITDLLAAPRAP